MKRLAAPLLSLLLACTPALAGPPGEVAKPLGREQIEAGLKSHDRAMFIKDLWIRDPYLTLGPDHQYYLVGTVPMPGDARERSDPYNLGMGPDSIVGSSMVAYRSKDLADWEDLGAVYTDADNFAKAKGKKANVLWAPEIHWLGDRWAMVHCPKAHADFAVTTGPELKGPWQHPMGTHYGDKHDPSLFQDGNTWWSISANTEIQPFKPDFSDFAGPAVQVAPTDHRIGHEGCTILKIEGKYVLFGTGWSTDKGRKGSYNLYYTTADKVTGPYGPRKFMGRFCGHGTPFQTADGQWWCTAFYNANTVPVPVEGIQSRDLAENAQTINQRGLTIVPLDVRKLADGDVYVRAIDPAYATPGLDEAQKFDPPMTPK